MTPAAYIKGILTENIEKIKPLSAEHVHAFFIPSDDQTTTDPILVVSEIPDENSDYGNDIPIQKGKRIQVEFYYPKDYSEDMSEIERLVEQLLLNNRIYCFSNAGHILTPDSQNINNTLKFNYKQEVI